ncbi:MAG: threonine--tRNA ligase, partial [Clostridia bacterium]|nr:threonine--tRNA ligase [Clostridia bacterium]
KYEGTAEQWDEAQSVMKRILDNIGLEYEIGIDEAAFYGPKLDIQCKNVFGKEDTIVTIQIDMLLAEKFGMYYTDSDDKQKLPYIIHRTSMGCYERTLALLIEKYAGAFPTWLAPVQVRVMPISDAVNDYAKSVAEALESVNVRVETDFRNEKIGYKIREAQIQKIPYAIVIGEKEAADGTVAVRNRKDGTNEVMSLNDFLAKITLEIVTKAR